MAPAKRCSAPAGAPAAPRAHTPVALDPKYTPKLLTDVKAIIVKCDITGEYQSGLADVQVMLRGAGLAWDQQIPIEHVGVSPYNRGGLGVAAGDAQRHLLDVTSLGFTWDRLEAFCKQSDQANPEFEWQFNERQVRLSKGLIPPLQLMSAVSLGGSHTQVGFRQAKGRVKALHPKLAGDDGNIDPDKLTMGKPAMAEALAKGLRWTVFHWQVEQAFPGFSQFVQKALNVEAKALRGEMEVFLEMWTQATTSAEAEVNWEEIENLVGKALSPCTSYIHTMSKHLQVHSGGLLEGINMFLKAFTRDDTAAALGGEFIQAVADLDLKRSKIPHVANALLEAQLLSPKIIDGICRSISVTKVAKLKSEHLRSKVLLAEQMMQNARELGKQLGLEENGLFVRQLGFLDVRLVCVLLDLSKTFEQAEWSSLEEVAKDLLQQIKTVLVGC